LPERHDAFAWAGLPGRSLGRSLVAQAKRIFCLCLSVAQLFFGDDPLLKLLIVLQNILIVGEKYYNL